MRLDLIFLLIFPYGKQSKHPIRYSLSIMRRFCLLIVFFGLLVPYGSVGVSAASNISSEGTVTETKPTKPGQAKARKTNLNLAGSKELSLLPGITPADADRIIQRRPYKNLDELLTKKVLGKKQFALIREYVIVGSREKAGRR